MARERNPLEVLTKELSDVYVALVNYLATFIAPVGPWWEADLDPDDQLFRWEGTIDQPGPRLPILEWLMQAGVYMGWKDSAEVLANIEKIFTDQHAADVIPPDLHENPEKNEGFVDLLEMVQATGPHEAAVHIRKMERLHENRLQGAAILKNSDQPVIPPTPRRPPLAPVELLPNTGGYPNFGFVPQDRKSGAGEPEESMPLGAG